jgi:hypothetical protein
VVEGNDHGAAQRHRRHGAVARHHCASAECVREHPARAHRQQHARRGVRRHFTGDERVRHDHRHGRFATSSGRPELPDDANRDGHHGEDATVEHDPGAAWGDHDHHDRDANRDDCRAAHDRAGDDPTFGDDAAASGDDPAAAGDDPAASGDDAAAAYDDGSAAYDDRGAAAYDDRGSAAHDDRGSAAYDDGSAAHDDRGAGDDPGRPGELGVVPARPV